MGKRYKLAFEYVSPFDGKWTPASNESLVLEELQEQLKNQLAMPDVRNSKILVQETTDWTDL